MTLNIMKIVDDETKSTSYITDPSDMHQILDTSKGCILRFGASRIDVHIHNKSARQMKREIQERLDEPPHFVKMTYTHTDAHVGLRYVNVAHVAGVTVFNVGRDDERAALIFNHVGAVLKTSSTAQSLAYQVRRILLKLDQDEEICCSAEDNEDE